MKRFDSGGCLSIREVIDLEVNCDVKIAGRITSVNQYGEYAPHLLHFVIEDECDELAVILPPSAWIWSVYVTCGREVVAAVRVLANEYFVRAIAESVWPKETIGIPPIMLSGRDTNTLCRSLLPIIIL